MFDNDFLLIASVVYWSLSVLSFLIILFIVYRIVRRFIRFLATTPGTVDTNWRISLISLGATVVIFPAVLSGLAQAIISFISTIIAQLPINISRNWNESFSLCGQGNPFTCIGSLGSGFVQVWMAAITDGLQSISQISFTQLVLFLAVWTLLAYVLNQFTIADQGNQSTSRGLAWLRSQSAQLNSTTMRIIAFSIILAIAGYLSIAAITAIPALQEETTTNQETSVEGLRIQLEGAYNQLNNKFSNAISTSDPLASLSLFPTIEQTNPVIPVKAPSTAPLSDTVAITNTNAITDPSQPVTRSITNTIGVSSTTSITPTIDNPPSTETIDVGPPSNIDNPVNQSNPRIPLEKLRQIQPIVGSLRTQREDLYDKWRQLVANVLSSQARAKDGAIREYAISDLEHKGNRERAEHFITINNWYNSRSAFFERNLANCRTSLIRMDGDLRALAAYIQASLASEDAPIFDAIPRDVRLFDDAQENCQPFGVNADLSDIPQRRALGSESMGPFGLVASWLLQTESLPLALITGMIGFGLLGAACSSFIRERAAKRGDPPFADLAGLILRGVSAAIVIFLGVEGGLAIFAAGSSEPNPYALLFTCLVAAVYSERVWEWAEGQILSRQGNPNNGQPPAQNGSDKTASDSSQQPPTKENAGE